MPLFDRSTLKAFSIGFVLGCLALVATLGGGVMPEPLTGSAIPAAQAETGR